MAVRRTPSAIGRISKLTVSITTSIGINSVGVPSGRRWPSEAVGWFRKPTSTVINQVGKARAIFIESCVVGVKV